VKRPTEKGKPAECRTDGEAGNRMKDATYFPLWIRYGRKHGALQNRLINRKTIETMEKVICIGEKT